MSQRLHENQSDFHSLASFDAKKLLYFFCVARAGSFTIAEAQLGVNQSTLTRSVQQLESDLGVTLLDRTGRGVVLTTAGNVFIEHAKRILDNMQEAMNVIFKLQHNPGDEISIAAPNMFATLYLPQVIRNILKKYPNLRMNIMEGSTGHVHERLAAGDIDIAVLVIPPRTPRITAKKILQEQLLLIVRSDHPMANKKSIDRKEAKTIELVLPASVHGSRKRINEYFEEAGVDLDIRINADSLAVTKALVCGSNLYGTILPRRACEHELQTGKLIGIPFSPSLQRSVFIGRLRDRNPSSYAIDIAREIELAVLGKCK